MKVDFLVFHSTTVNLMETLLDCLLKSYENNYDEPPAPEELLQSVTIRYSQRHIQTQENEDNGETAFTCGFSVDFDMEDIEQAEPLIKDFCQELTEYDEVIKHVLKLTDPYLRIKNRKYADEVFEIEMKLREAISLIFLDTYGDDFYNLLKDIDVKPKEKNLKPKQMQERWENEFFYLLFSDYIKLNERKQSDKATDLIQLISKANDYEAFKHMLTSKPIENERYSDFLASLETHVDPIEKVRNCVAHNRTIPQRVLNNYGTAKELLISSIDSLLAEFEEDHGFFWEEEAREAMVLALDSAVWDTENGEVTIYNSYDENEVTCNSIDELRNELERLASDTAHGYIPSDTVDGIFDYDSMYAASEIVEEYEEQIEAMGWSL